MKRVLGSLAFLASVWALAPPHPDFAEEYKRSRRRQRRLRGSSGYDAAAAACPLDPIFCDDLDEADCRRLSLNYARSAGITLEIMKQTGVLKPLVILMKFSDHSERPVPRREQMDELWNSGQITDMMPTGSLRRFVEINSYGLLSLQANVMDWRITNNSEEHYSFGKSGLTQQFSESIVPILQQLDDENFDFAAHDSNGDQVIDSLVILHSGYPAEVGGSDCQSGSSYTQRIWSHAIPHINDEWRSKTGFTFQSYMVASGMSGMCNSNPAPIGVMMHEMIHTWGVPDLYDTSGEWIGRGTGQFSIMSEPFGADGQQTHPPHLDPWSRIMSGWLKPVEITFDGEYTLTPSSSTDHAFIIRHNYPGGEYLLIENRQPIEYDQLMPGGGILIWHVDENKEANTERGYPGQSGWPGNGKHYKIAVLQADGGYHLEKGENNGDQNDFFVKGKELQVGPEDSIATDFSAYPNTNSYAAGSIASTGVRLYDFSESGEKMTFRVSGIAPNPNPPTPLPSPAPTSPPSPLPTLPPTNLPTPLPTRAPVPPPSSPPTARPTAFPTLHPTTALPTLPPTTALPTLHPTTALPTLPPTIALPTPPPTTALPTLPPTTALPTLPPTFPPTPPPTASPTTTRPSRPPTKSPTLTPTEKPTASPSIALSEFPSVHRSGAPSIYPSAMPSTVPTAKLSNVPSLESSDSPSTKPVSEAPSTHPNPAPSETPSDSPSGTPSVTGSLTPSEVASEIPSTNPSNVPTELPSAKPSNHPTTTTQPSKEPTISFGPSFHPTVTATPTETPTASPYPTVSEIPTSGPTISFRPTSTPTEYPTTVMEDFEVRTNFLNKYTLQTLPREKNEASPEANKWNELLTPISFGGVEHETRLFTKPHNVRNVG